MHKSIGFHTRLERDHTVKICGGSFGGAVDMETVNRLVKSHFTVSVKSSGRPVFVDREGREVNLYISVDPETTDAGKAVMTEYRKQEAATREALEKVDREKESRIAELMDSLSSDEIIRRLTE